MNVLDVLAAHWCRLGWLLMLIFTASTLVVALLRKPCRKTFGAEHAFVLWLLPPLAMLASLLPHASARAASLPAIVVAITMLPGNASPARHAVSGHWQSWIAALWLVGVATTLLFAVYSQTRYRARLRGAMRYSQISSRWPIVRARVPHTGPALVGAFGPCIVLPSDFESHYDSTERTLILAHETMHARRHDGVWSLFAQLVIAIFWFHPLAWWALSALRRDQEMACDAAVLREHGGRRRSYGIAMLKAASASSPLPIGCSWSSRHPLTERIAMLKQSQPTLVRRGSGVVVVAAAILFGAGCAYAASGVPAASARAGEGRYTLKLVLATNGRPPRLHATACLTPGKSYTLTNGVDDTLPPWRGRFSVTSAPDGLLEVRTELGGGTLEKPVSPRVRTRPGQTATIMLGEKSADEAGRSSIDHTIKIDLTPSVGC